MNVEASPRPDLVERLRAHPAGRRLLELDWAEPAFLVGGSVRDMLLGETPSELDVVVEGNAHDFATRLAESAGTGRPEAMHDRFETATLLIGTSGAGTLTGTPLVGVRPLGYTLSGTGREAGEHDEPLDATVRVDVARARTEVYESPGALPLVRPAVIEQDLSRRDFSVNAIALRLAPGPPGELLALVGSLEDLGARCLRVLHERSFLDDPTRLLRLARYASRLGFAVAPDTDRRAREALAAGALESVSGGRLGAEVRLALAEPDPVAAFGALDELGLLKGLHPRLRWDGELVARAHGLAAKGGRVDLLVLASTLLPLTLRADGGPRGADARALLDRLEFPAGERDRAVGAAVAAPGLIDVLEGSPSASALWEALVDVPLEGVALAGAMTGGGEAGPGSVAARRWLEELRFVRLRIDGRDLLAAGVPEGPEIGRRLEAALRLRLDGGLPDEREAQLAAALAGD